MGKRKKGRGHYCWACGQIRPNEKFSGKGHRQHLCKDCKRLGREELVVLQAERNMDRVCGPYGVLRKHKRGFQKYLQSNNPRIREYAQRLVAEGKRLREVEAEENAWYDAGLDPDEERLWQARLADRVTEGEPRPQREMGFVFDEWVEEDAEQDL